MLGVRRKLNVRELYSKYRLYNTCLHGFVILLDRHLYAGLKADNLRSLRSL